MYSPVKVNGFTIHAYTYVEYKVGRLRVKLILLAERIDAVSFSPLYYTGNKNHL